MDSMFWLQILTGCSAVTSLWSIYRLNHARRAYRWDRSGYDLPLSPPSVSICIPARNEAHALSFCLERVLASDYRKLEILVLDDNSDDDTSVLIKSFAHAGVRLIAGKPLPSGWLGKNHALDTMAREASGDVVIFMDVDTQVEPTTISKLVATMVADQADMVSVLPQRRDTGRANVLFGHLRYFWELVLARQPAPASSSALWMIGRKDLLEHLGGFTRLAGQVQPERALAAWMARSGRYACVMSSPELGVYYEKRWSSQRETSQRLLLPLLGSSAYGLLVGFIGLFVTSLSVLSVVTLIIDMAGWPLVAIMWLLGLTTYYVYLRMVWASRRLISLIVWPVVIIQEMIFLCSSVLRYASGTVTWKGRSVHAPGLNHQYLSLDE